MDGGATPMEPAMDEIASFGKWLKLRRIVLELSQAELARLAGCSTVTIRKIEADERRPSPALVSRLADAQLRMAQGEVRQGLQLYYAAQRAFEELGAGLGLERSRIEAQAAAAREQLDASAVVTVEANGQAMTLEQAVADALAEDSS